MTSVRLHGPLWAVLTGLVVLAILAAGTVKASPAWAQSELGDELAPPTAYPTDPDAGIVPVGNYDIGCANQGLFGDITCVTLGAGTNLLFSVGKLVVAVSLWLLETAVGFTMEATLTDAATSIADLLDTRVLGPMNLAHLGLVVSAFYMGWQFLRGRVGLGAGEFVISLVILGVLLHVSTGPGFGQTVTGAINTAGVIATEIVALAADTDPDTGAGERVGSALIAGFVRDPYDTINWGRPLTGTGCEPARSQILATGPHGYDDTPRQDMTAAGCTAEAEFNASASAGRLVGALLYSVVSVAALLLLGVTAFTLVVAKGLSLFLIALLPIALYAGVFPGAGRSLLWHWVTSLIRILALIIALGVFLALLVAGLTGLLGLTRGLWERFLLVVFFMAVMWVGRRQLVDISARFSDSTLHRLEGAHLGGAHGATWIRPYQAGGLTGLGVTRTIRETSAETPHLPQQTVKVTAAKAAAAWAKRAP